MRRVTPPPPEGASSDAREVLRKVRGSPRCRPGRARNVRPSRAPGTSAWPGQRRRPTSSPRACARGRRAPSPRDSARSFRECCSRRRRRGSPVARRVRTRLPAGGYRAPGEPRGLPSGDRRPGPVWREGQERSPCAFRQGGPWRRTTRGSASTPRGERGPGAATKRRGKRPPGRSRSSGRAGGSRPRPARTAPPAPRPGRDPTRPIPDRRCPGRGDGGTCRRARRRGQGPRGATRRTPPPPWPSPDSAGSVAVATALLPHHGSECEDPWRRAWPGEMHPAERAAASVGKRPPLPPDPGPPRRGRGTRGRARDPRRRRFASLSRAGGHSRARGGPFRARRAGASTSRCALPPAARPVRRGSRSRARASREPRSGRRPGAHHRRRAGAWPESREREATRGEGVVARREPPPGAGSWPRGPRSRRGSGARE